MVRSRIAGRFLAVAALAGVSACGAADESTPAATTVATTPVPSAPKVTDLLGQALPNVQGKTFTSSIVDFPPGVGSAPHRHGQAFVFAYVLKGAVVSKVDNQPEITYHQGQNWVEQPGAHHVVAKNPSKTEPAKLLVVYVSTTGDPLLVNDSPS